MGYFIVFFGGALTATVILVIAFLVRLQKLREAIQQQNEQAAQLDVLRDALNQKQGELDQERATLQRDQQALEARAVQYSQLLQENNSLKQDLFNLSVHIRKTERDHDAIQARQIEIDRQSSDLASRYMKDQVEWISSKLTPNNFSSSKARLLKAIERCRAIGFEIGDSESDSLLQNLQQSYEQVVRKDIERQEQARIKAQIREEQRLEREIQKHIDDATREQAAIEAALQAALKEAQDEHSAEVEALKAKLKEAEDKTARAISQAQLTKTGYVYVISNIGSFGENVFKIGMTRRLEPLDRVKELGDASVPFPFDVHMMISSNDAPSLENALHKAMHVNRVNKVNFRKEFFRADIETICKIVEEHHGQVEYVASPEAFEYRETLSMPDEDYDYVEQVAKSMSESGVGN